jgi:hypothetical protein
VNEINQCILKNNGKTAPKYTNKDSDKNGECRVQNEEFASQSAVCIPNS